MGVAINWSQPQLSYQLLLCINVSLINEQLTTHGTQLLYIVTTEILMHVSAYIMLHLPFRAK